MSRFSFSKDYGLSYALPQTELYGRIQQLVPRWFLHKYHGGASGGPPENEKAFAEREQKKDRARRELSQAENGVFKGTRTWEELKAAAEKYYSLGLKDEARGRQQISAEASVLGLRAEAAREELARLRVQVPGGSVSEEDFERALKKYHDALALFNGAPLPPKVEALFARESKSVRQTFESIRKARGQEEARRRKEDERLAAEKKKLAAAAEDGKLSEAVRESARARLNRLEQEERVRVATGRVTVAEAEAARVRRGVFEGTHTFRQAEEAYRALAEALREHEEAQAARFLDERVNRHVDDFRQNLARRRAETERKREEAVQARLLEKRRRREEAEASRLEAKRRAAEERGRKLRAKKEREERERAWQVERNWRRREETERKRRMKLAKEAAAKVLREEIEGMKKRGLEYLCEYRLISADYQKNNEQVFRLAKVCFSTKESRNPLSNLHAFTKNVLVIWSNYRIPADKSSRDALVKLRKRFARLSSVPDDTLLTAFEKVSKPGDEMGNLSALYASCFDLVLYSNGDKLSGAELRRVQEEIVSELGEMLEAFNKPPLPEAIATVTL
jgi:hypothetical protein